MLSYLSLSYCFGADPVGIGVTPPQGLLGSGKNGYLFQGSWGALIIILKGGGASL